MLGRYLSDKAGRHFNSQVDAWYMENPTLWYAMDQMNATFGPKVSKSQALRHFTAKKDNSITWSDHLLFLMAVAHVALFQVR